MASRDGPCTVSEIAQGISSPRSTTYLLIEQLESRGYIDRYAGRQFQLGRRAALIGKAAMRRMDFARFVRTLMDELAAESGQLAELVSLDNWRQLVLIATKSRRDSYVLSEEGARHPLPRTASSRLLLRDYTKEEIFANLPAEDYLLRDGSRLDPESFYASIEAARGLDAIALLGQVDPHLACLASPINDSSGKCVATVSLVIPIVEFEGRFEFFAEMTRRATRVLNEQLSLTPPGPAGLLGLMLNASE